MLCYDVLCRAILCYVLNLSIFSILLLLISILLQVKHGDLVRLRHLLSGQYLCIRPSNSADTGVIRDESSILGMATNQQKKELIERSNRISHSNSIVKSMANTIIPFEMYHSNAVNENDKKIDEKEKIRVDRVAFIEKIKNNSSVATTSEPDNTTLFFIFSCDYSRTKRPESSPLLNTEMKNISLNESIFFQHEMTTCRLKLHEKTKHNTLNEKNHQNIPGLNLNSDSQVSEYQNDVPVQPSDPSESKASILISVNANAYKLEEVELEEVRDIMFACRFGSLIRTAVLSVQNPSKNGPSGAATIYRHLSCGLSTLSQWAILKFGNEAALMEYSTIDSLNRRKLPCRRASVESNYSAALTDDSHDEGEISKQSTRTRSLTVVERMDRTVYPAVVDNSSFDNSFASLISNPNSASKSSQREVIDAISRATIKRRQGLLSDCRLLEMALHFSNIIFTLIRDQDNRLDELRIGLDEIAYENGTGRRRSRSSGSSAPQVLIDCCILVHEIIRSAVSLDNKKNALKIISFDGKS